MIGKRRKKNDTHSDCGIALVVVTAHSAWKGGSHCDIVRARLCTSSAVIEGAFRFCFLFPPHGSVCLGRPSAAGSEANHPGGASDEWEASARLAIDGRIDGLSWEMHITHELTQLMWCSEEPREHWPTAITAWLQ